MATSRPRPRPSAMIRTALGVSTKCTFCVDRIDAGIAKGLTPGQDPDATPACVNSCIARRPAFRRHRRPGQQRLAVCWPRTSSSACTRTSAPSPGFYYLWDGNDQHRPPPARQLGLARRRQLHLLAAPARASWSCRLRGMDRHARVATGGLAALALSVAGSAWSGLRSAGPGVFSMSLRNPATSWMSREAWAAVGLMPAGVLAALTGSAVVTSIAAAAGLFFLLCQAQMLRAARGIPAWRDAAIVPLVAVTGLTEGAGLMLAAAAFTHHQPQWLPITALIMVLWRTGSGACLRCPLAPAKSTRRRGQPPKANDHECCGCRWRDPGTAAGWRHPARRGNRKRAGWIDRRGRWMAPQIHHRPFARLHPGFCDRTFAGARRGDRRTGNETRMVAVTADKQGDLNDG